MAMYYPAFAQVAIQQGRYVGHLIAGGARRTQTAAHIAVLQQEHRQKRQITYLKLSI